jgi:hypothetical protein
LQSALTPEDIEARKAAIEDLWQRYREVAARNVGATVDPEADARGATGRLVGHLPIDEFVRMPGADGKMQPNPIGPGARGGGVGAASTVQEEEITEDQKMAMAENRQIDRAIDQELSKWEEALDDILHANKGLSEALDESAARLDDLAGHVDKTTERLERVTKQIQRVVDTSNDASSKCCSYLICIIILLGIATVIFNVVSKRT